ncbi:SpoIIE family protein phosphatase [Blastococcus xanthinilyticus]|uniref:Serine/threonine-protein kinase RsbW n=1 Tax=Blastococcus xanthinilyticus TaxID=1564164 RepID=A0A5S5CPZ9_9ACTN|nr:SpoIIE family protein phosphatase [Blastococcus xanthinilyticus]TYP82919.1 serine/threonine-protein kinase RsbW [Blastococcus xanthinilyticus]
MTGRSDAPPPGPDDGSDAPRSDPEASSRLARLLEGDPADLYENAPMGYLSTLPDGRIVKVNRTFCAWTGRAPGDLLGTRLQELLTVGGRVFHETHIVPLLRMQGAVREIAIDITRIDGSLLACLLNAVELRDDDGTPLLIRATLFEATARRRYERELLAAQRLAEESEARSRVVQKVVFDLAAATTPEDVATVIVQRGRAAMKARGAALVLVEGEADDPRGVPQLRPVRSDGLSAGLLRRLREAAGSRLALELVQGLRSIVLDARLRADQPDLAAAMVADGVTDLVVVPVSADSKRLGVLVLARGAPGRGDLISLDEPGSSRPPSPAEVDLLWTLGRQAGQALERVRLHEQTRLQGERAAFLLEAARLMADADDVSETVQRLAGLVASRLATVCAIELVTEQGLTRAVARHRDGARQPLLDRLRAKDALLRSPLHPAVRALREGRTQWMRDREEVRAVVDAVAVDDEFRDLAEQLELTATVSVPMVVDGRRLGVMTFAGDRQRPLTAADVEVAEQLALQLSQVLDKAQRFELEERTSHTLQASLLPPSPPDVPGLDTAVRYVAATHGVDVGGDFYDLVRLPGEQVSLVVGDVVGHDITAAATMGQLRTVIRAMSADGPPPAVLVDRLQRSWGLYELQRMATALFATLDPATGGLRIASAGHLPPVLCGSGRAEYLPVRPTRMLGAPPVPAEEWAGELPVGATLLLFTDGLVESTGADIDTGLDRLLEVAAKACAGDPGELCDRLLEELTGDHRADDIALLALTRR